MCGIAGVLDPRGATAHQASVERMGSALAHRGPDAESLWLAGPVAFAHRRLSILDIACGAQPLSNESGTVTITFNGEVYNFAELTSAAQARGHTFRSRSDTEAIVHTYEDYGVDCVKRLRGMFAFALWDEDQRRLLLARDRLGKKPLFYARAGEALLFASELHALVRHPGIAREIDPIALDQYLTYGYIPAPRTIYRNVFKLAPAHTVTATLDGAGGCLSVAEPERFWHLDYVPKTEMSDDDAENALIEKLTEAVRLRMVADVPVGALLSGGVDSSLIVALMAQQSDQKIRTFSIGFDDAAYNELPYARAVAERYGTQHEEMIVRPDAMGVLPTLVKHYGEPYADSSAVPTYYVAQMTSKHVKVAMNGDGGDEALAGYDRYLGSMAAERYQELPAMFRRRVLQPAAAMIPDSLPARHRLRQLKRFTSVAALPIERRYVRWMSFFTQEQKAALYTPGFREELGGYDGSNWLRDLILQTSSGGLPHLDRLLSADVQSYLPYDLLVKMDIASMANSLETRSPFLDQEVMAFCARLPTRFKIRRGGLKYLAKRVASKYVPAENLRRRKMGFGVPVGRWLREDLAPLLDEVLLAPESLARGYFDAAAVGRLVREHRQGEDRSYQLWSLLWLELWHREFLN